MIRKYHNHTLQTTPWHSEEEPLNYHETPGRQIKQSNQLSLFPIKRSLSESSHVAYQKEWRKEYHASTYYVLTHTLGWVKLSEKILKEISLHIKLKGMEHRAPRKHIFCPYSHTLSPWSQVKRSKRFCLDVVMLRFKLKGKNYRAPHKHILCPYTHP